MTATSAAATTSDGSPRRLARAIRLLALGIWRDSVMWWSFRGLVFNLVVGQSVTPLLGLLVWSSVLPGSQGVATYYVVLLAVQLMTVSYEHHTLANGIYAGNFADVLVKPRPVVFEFLATNLAIRIWHLAFGIPVIVAVGWLAGISLAPSNVVRAIPVLLLAAAIRFVFTYTIAISAIWMQKAHGAVGMGETLIFLLGGTAAPLSLLPGAIGNVGRLLPFWSMLGAPADVASGYLDSAGVLETLALQGFWLVVLSLVATAVWKLGVRHFTAFGG